MRDVPPLTAPEIGASGPATLLHLQAFSGPLDLLLHLVRTSEIDVTTIALAEVARQYNGYLDGLSSPIDPEAAGEYLVMAATLVHLKSRRILPPEPMGADPILEDQDGTPGLRFPGEGGVREAAAHLQEREALMERLYHRPAESVAEYASERGIEADLFSLLRAFQAILRRVADDRAACVSRERITLVERIDWLLLTLRRERRVGFRSLFQGLPDRVSCILTFLALLEVIRLRLVRAYSSHRHQDLLIVLAEDEPRVAAEEAPRA